jgi:hypothetical protein
MRILSTSFFREIHYIRGITGARQRVPFQNAEDDEGSWPQQDDYDHYSNAFANTGESLPPPPPPSQPSQLEIDQSHEIEALRKELKEVKQQAIDMSKDNQELAKLLKETRQELKTKYLKSAVPTASKSVQADDIITAAELQRLKAQLNVQEGKNYQSLQAHYFILPSVMFRKMSEDRRR